MRAIILAAGRGSRMKNLTDERPKCLVELRGKTLLERQLQSLRTAGVTDIAIVTGYKRELLVNQGLKEFHNPLWASTNMVSSLACASDWLGADPCLVSYSDIFYDEKAVTILMNSQASLAVTYDPNWRVLWESRFTDPLSDAETFQFNAKSVVTEIGQKPKRIEDIQGQYMGLLRFTPSAWKGVEVLLADLEPINRDKLDMTGMLQLLITNYCIEVQALPYTGIWGEIDSEADLDLYKS